MDQNQTVDNDLQKAIDDITNNTNIDPVFSDPVAAPSSVPEGDTGVLDDPVGPFTTPEPQASNAAQDSSEFVAEPTVPPLDNFGVPVFDTPAAPAVGMPEFAQMPNSMAADAPAMAPQEAPMPPQTAPEIYPPMPPADVQSAGSRLPEAPVHPPVRTSVEVDTVVASSPSGLSMRQVKTAALRDLVPLIDRLSLSPSQRFNMCKNIFEELRDYSVLEQAYKAASEIPDSTERAEALLYLVESIDKI